MARGKASLTIAIGGEFTGRNAIRQAASELRQLREEAREAEGAASSIMKVGDSFVDLGSSMEVAGEKAARIGGSLTKATAPLTAVAAASVKMASDYEASAAKVYTIMDKQAMGTEEMSRNILDLSTATGKGATELAEASYQALSASVETSKVGGFVEQSVKLAKAGFTETATAVDTLTTVINAYGLRAEDADMISNRLVQTQNKGKTTVAELASSMGSVIPTAAAYNVSLDNLCSGYVALTKQGIDTANATTALNGMFTELADSGSAVAQVLKQRTGKTFGQLMADGQTLGSVIGTLSDSVDGNSEAFANLWGNVRASRAALAIANAGADEFDATMRDMADSAGLVDSALADLQTPTAKFQKAVNALKNTGIELGEEILGTAAPAIEGLAEKADALYKWFGKLDEGTKQSIVRFGALAVAAGPVVTLLGKGTSALGGLLVDIGKGAQRVGVFTAAMRTAEAEMRAAGAESVSYAAKMRAAAEATGMAEKATVRLKGAVVALKSVGIVLAISKVVETVAGLVEHMDTVNRATQDITQSIDTMTAAIGESEQALGPLEAIFDKFGMTLADGGAVKSAVKAMADLNDESTESIAKIKATSAEVDHYAASIIELAGKESLTAEEQARLAASVSGFNEKTKAGLSVIDQQTGKLSMSRDAILEVADAWKEQAEAEAYKAVYTKYTEQMLENTIALEDAQKQLVEASKGAGLGIAAYLLGPVGEADRRYYELEQSVKDLTAAQETARRNADAALAKMSEHAGALSTVSDAAEDTASSLGDVADATQDAEEASKAYQKQLDAQYKSQQKAYDNAYKAAQKSLDAEAKALQKSLDAEAKALQKAHDAELKELQKSLDARYDAQQKKLDKQYSALSKALSKEEDALKESNEKRLDALKASQDREVEAFKAATEKKIELMRKQRDASLAAISDEEDARIAAIDRQIGALEDEGDASDKAVTEAERAQKKSELQKAINASKSSTARARAEKALSDYLAQIAREDAEEARKLEIAKLRDAKEAIKAEADAREDAVKTRYEADIAAYEAKRAAELEAMKAADAAELEQLKLTLAAREERMSEAHARQLESLKESQEQQLSSLKEAQELQLESLRESQQEQQESQREANSEMLESLREAQQESLAAMKESQQDALSALKEAQQEQLEAYKSARESQGAELDGMASDAKESAKKAKEGMHEETSQIPDKVKQTAEKIRAWFKGETGKMPSEARSVGLEVGLKISEAMEEKRERVNAAADVLREQVKKSLGIASDDARGAGSAAAGSFKDAIGEQSAYERGRQLALSGKTGMTSVETYAAGQNFSTGFVNGMQGVDLYTYSYNYGLGALDAIKRALGIASPSKEAAWVGEMYGQGVALGMGRSERAVEAASARLTDAMTLEPTPHGTFAAPGTYSQYSAQAQQAARQIVINMTLNVTARSEAEAVSIGKAAGESLYEEFVRRERLL